MCFPLTYLFLFFFSFTLSPYVCSDLRDHNDNKAPLPLFCAILAIVEAIQIFTVYFGFYL